MAALTKLAQSPLWMKILIGMALGLIVGTTIPGAEQLKPLGDLFIRLIKMLVVPLIFCSLISGVTAMHDMATMGRMAGKAIAIYMVTTLLAIVIGLSFGIVINPGGNVDIDVPANTSFEKHETSVVETLLDIVPTNIITALNEGNTLQIIFFALFFGTAIVMVGSKAAPIIPLNEAILETMYKMTHLVMGFAPIGVFGLIANVAAVHGLEAMSSLLSLVACVLLATITHVLLVYGGILWMFKINPLQFFRKSVDAMMVAFSTSSSSATLPVTIETAEKNLGVSKPTASFVLPLGTTINMDGSALYQGVCALFLAQAAGMDLTLAQMATIVAITTLASIGTAGIPGVSLVILTMVLDSVGIPLEGIAMLFAVDRVLDMVRTAVNVTGDLFVSSLVDSSEKRMDMEIFHSNKDAL